jgi:chemotaxis protein methyltransferase CheR
MDPTTETKEFVDFLDANDPTLSRAIIDTVQEALVVLDGDLRFVAASESFYRIFDLDHARTRNKLFYEIGSGQWNIPDFRKLLEEVLSKNKTLDNYEVPYDLEAQGLRRMLVNAREILNANSQRKMLLSIFDVTRQRQLESERENLAQQKDILLREMRHRIANSLQIIASILILKAQNVTSEETRRQLEDVHDRIMSIATVQGHLDPEGLGTEVDVSTYLKKLCESLTASMIGDRRPISIKVAAEKKKVTTDEAIGLGLITTELIINALKHAFVSGREGTVTVEYKVVGEEYWKLSIADDGIGISPENLEKKGLGTGIIDSLTKQLEARVVVETSPKGTTVSVIHGETQ